MLMPDWHTKGSYRVVPYDSVGSSNKPVLSRQRKARLDVRCFETVFPFNNDDLPPPPGVAPMLSYVPHTTPEVRGRFDVPLDRGRHPDDDLRLELNVHSSPPVQPDAGDEKYAGDVASEHDLDLDSQSESEDAPPLRRSGRRRVPSAPAFDPVAFEVQQKHDQSHFANSDDRVYYNIVTDDDDNDEPHFPQAMRSADKHHWVSAIYEEIDNQKITGSFVVEVLPVGAKVIGSRWVFKRKRDRHGKVVRFKARLVAQGFSQVEGQHFFQTFSPTLKMPSLRFLLANTANRRWTLLQLDVTSAFLCAKLPPAEVIYMRPPPGITIPSGHALKLQRCIYGLRQASHHWNKEFHSTLLSLGFTSADADPCVYTLYHEGTIVATLALFVDDILLTGNEDIVTPIKKKLMMKYKMTDGGVPNFFLGIAIDYNRDAGRLTLSQQSYVTKVLTKYNMRSEERRVGKECRSRWSPYH
jgi:hypothetical protein